MLLNATQFGGRCVSVPTELKKRIFILCFMLLNATQFEIAGESFLPTSEEGKTNIVKWCIFLNATLFLSRGGSTFCTEGEKTNIIKCCISLNATLFESMGESSFCPHVKVKLLSALKDREKTYVIKCCMLPKVTKFKSWGK